MENISKVSGLALHYTSKYKQLVELESSLLTGKGRGWKLLRRVGGCRLCHFLLLTEEQQNDSPELPGDTSLLFGPYTVKTMHLNHL